MTIAKCAAPIAIAIAWGLGVSFGVVVGVLPRASRVSAVVLSALIAVPLVVLYPLFIAWLGLGPSSKVVFGVISGIFPIALNTMIGVQGIDRGYARMAHAMSGVGYLAGDPDRPPSNPGPPSLADYVSAVYAALGVLLALKARERDGQGQVVDVALYEAMFRSLDECLPAFAKHGKVRERDGSRTSNAAPNANFPTRDGKWVSLTTADDKTFVSVTAAMARPDLVSDSRFSTMAARIANRGMLEDMVAEWTKTLDREQLIALCETHDVPCMAVLSIADIWDNPQFRAREMFVTLTDPEAGAIALPAVVPKLSRTPGRVESLGPTLGEANDDVYRRRLGLSEKDMAALKAEGVI